MTIYKDLTIRDWVDRCHGLAREKGWYDRGPEFHALTADQLLAKVMLDVTELAEAVELVRMPDFNPRDVWADANGVKTDLLTAKEMSGKLQKPEGFGTELADAVIRIFDLCGALGIDLEARIAEKHDYNATREVRHGGKQA
jgi:NTP pyrophosphatase (non-canonical NTP hydrolase)